MYPYELRSDYTEMRTWNVCNRKTRKNTLKCISDLSVHKEYQFFDFIYEMGLSSVSLKFETVDFLKTL